MRFHAEYGLNACLGQSQLIACTHCSEPIVDTRCTLAPGIFLARAMRDARRKSELRVPLGRRAANLRWLDNDGEGPSPMHVVSRAQVGEEARD